MTGKFLEIELKLQLQKRVPLSRIKAAVGPGPIKEIKTKKVVNTYFDTDDDRLNKRHMALRVREADGRLLQTLKLGAQDAVLQSRSEWECEVDTIAPDLDRFADDELRLRIGWLTEGMLQPVFKTEFTRHQIELAWPPGRIGQSRIEMAVDEGTVSAGSRKSTIREIELELKSGVARHLFDLAAHLGQSLPLRPSTGSKATSGYRLARQTPIEPQRAKPPLLEPSLPASQALGLMLREATQQWIGNVEPALDGADPEGVHQLRVGLRRLRSLLSLFRDWFVPEVAANWQAVLRGHLRELGPARQLDVFLSGTIEPLRGLLPDEGSLVLVSELAQSARAKAYDKLRRHLRAPATSSAMLDFLCWIEQEEWLREDLALGQMRLEEAASRILRKRYEKLCKRGKNFAQMEMEQRHELRLSLKKLRYAVDFLGPVFEDSRGLRKALSRLQDELGVANDLEEARGMISQLSGSTAGPKARAALARLDGIVLGWSLERIGQQEARTLKAWKEFKSAPMFWEVSS